MFKCYSRTEGELLRECWILRDAACFYKCLAKMLYERPIKHG